MKRVPTRRAEIGISLFPFLAVLICTMGALIVLLVLVVQQARVQADTICDQVAEQLREQRSAERQRQQQDEEDYRWKQEILQQQRHELTERLGDGRLKLGHLEDHIRRLELRWTLLRAEWKDLQTDGEHREEDREAARRELVRLQSELDAERERLADARQQLAKRERSFSIIPYDGPHGTRRRPIYIECRESGIIIQPEGIVLSPQDLAGPLGPGNPLDASLRAIREYWNRAEGQSKFGEPYPLLIVRSDGAVAYSMARSAMANWDDEFGYELVGADTPLEFPPSDPQLRSLLETTVQAARQRQAVLAAAMPKRFSAPSPESFRLGDAGANWSDVGATHQAGSGGAGSLRNGFGTGGFAGSGSPRPTGSIGPGGTGDTGNHRGPVGRMGPGEQAANSVPPGTTGSGGTSGSEANAEPGETAGPGTTAGSGTIAGQAGQDSGSRHGAASDGAAGQDGIAGSGQAGHGRPSGTGGSGGPGGPNAGAGGGSAGPAGANSAGASASMAESTPLPDNIARQRGPNWALPNAALTSTGITRPILVECHPDRLVILPDRGDHRDPQVFPLQGAMRGTIQPFVAGIWNHTERWGMAVAGGYWKPVIRVQVAPEAHVRFLELRALLQDSGIEVEQR